MIDQRLRPVFQKVFVANVAKILGNKVKPNAVTLLALFVGLLSALSLFYDKYLCVLLLLLSGYLDILDGSIARLQNSSSNFGTLLDILSDRAVEVFIIVAIFINQPLQNLWIAVFIFISISFCMYSFLLVGIFSQKESKKSFYYSPGLIERAETFVFFIIMILLPTTVFYLGVIYTILVLWTAGYRCYEFYCSEKISKERT
ncbi:CDP-alcohol phosphatidyltransferase [Candidatus Francisella endociliophora]|uniref:CDP-alcohol phosphatidyltransferase n=1 Tax=Candidatus Francisella endociliophora TaxID=653937 RepID=A0A097EQS6_9GAMM|nr:CDP-alcohol phosphatidyltransferase family protein [Francisella sp. FSC1006]AIT09918.1 CDP-alcohol phosphatidyltransferase [Francisella sp. FSC1006]